MVDYPFDKWLFRVKDIMWRDNQPYAYHLKLGKWIRMKSLHFQGGSKPLMKVVRREAKK